MRIFLLLLNACAIYGTQKKLRLWGGQGPCDGRVEVFYKGEWGVICNHKWNIANEKVICRALGCGTHTVSSTEHSSTNPPKKVWMNEINCTGEEKDLWDCQFNGFGIIPCNYDTQHIIINCSETVVLSLSQECAGTVLVTTSTSKGIVCQNTWGTPEANVVCRELNCGTSLVIPPPGLFAARDSTAITALGCEGKEKHLWQCHKEITQSSCLPPNSTAGVICSNHHRLRLTGGANLCSGNLEVEVKDTWKPACQTNFTEKNPDKICSEMHCGTSGQKEHSSCTASENFSLTCSDTVKVVLLNGAEESRCFGAVHFNRKGNNEAVCSDEWDINDGSVVCKELGCGWPLLVSLGEWTPDARVNNVFCFGSESSVFHCMANYQKVTGCTKATVTCSSSIEVRLADGAGRCAGRVEILFQGKWMRLPSEGWTMNESDVVCRELDCGKGLMMGEDLFIHGTRPLWNRIVSCDKNASTIADCLRNEKEVKNLKTNIKVICQKHQTLYLESKVACTGRVAIQSNGTTFWLAASEETWNAQSATVVCRQMQCGNYISFKSEQHDGQTATWWTHMYRCSQNETSLFDCPSREENLVNHSKIAFVRCSGNVSISLNGGCWGKVMVHTEGKIGAVCADTWNNNLSTRLCKSLGCGAPVTEIKGERIPGGVTIGSMYCVGTDNLLTQCNFIPNSDLSYCQDKPAYVTCAGSIKPRIQDPKEKCSGNVELFHSGRWYPVCSKVLNENLLNQICKELRCGTALPGKGTALYTEKTKQGFSTITGCKNGNFSISDCKIGTELKKCVQGHVRCSGWARIMLKDLSPCEGKVYALTQEDLYSVSSQGWGDKEVQVLCKYLRCGNRVHHESRESSLKLWWEHSYNCNGNETSIWQCKQTEAPTEHKQLYIRCTDNPVVKLIDTPGRCFGTVEVTASGQARNICSTQWDEKHSQLLCQQLNCSGAIAHNSVKPTHQLTAHYFNCTGKESMLWQCGSNQRECSSFVSVVCSDSIRLQLSEKCGGTVEIFYRGVWEPVCPEPNMPSKQICSELNCGKVISHTPKVIPKARLLDIALVCTGSETYIKHCVRKKACGTKTPGQVYCEGYVPERERAIPVGAVVGVVLGLLLMTVTAVLIFWQWRRKRSSRLRRVARNAFIFDSGEYEDIEPSACEMLAPEVKSSAHLELASRVLPKESDAGWNNRQDSVSSSQSVYDNIEKEDSDSDELMNKGGHRSSNQKLAMENEINGLPGPAPEVTEEDYDDITTSPVVKEPPVTQGMGNCEIGGDEEYIEPIE